MTQKLVVVLFAFFVFFLSIRSIQFAYRVVSENFLKVIKIDISRVCNKKIEERSLEEERLFVYYNLDSKCEN